MKPERAEKKREEHGLDSKIYTSYEEMLDTEELDAVHICTPHYLHAQMAIYALRRNINVLLEKPMCISREQIRELIDAEKESTAVVSVCFQNRFNRATRQAKKIIDADGGAISAYGTVLWDRQEKYYTESDWRGRWETEGGSVMINQAIHTVDLLGYFLGKPQSVTATIANHHLAGVIDTEDTAEGIIKYDTGAQACFYATTAYSGASITRIFILTKSHRLEIVPPNLFVDGRVMEEDAAKSEFATKECYGDGHRHLITAFYDALELGTPHPVPLKSAQYALSAVLAAYESNGREIAL